MKVKMPADMQKRKNLYSMMLSLNKNNGLTFEELEGLCIKRGYLVKEEE